MWGVNEKKRKKKVGFFTNIYQRNHRKKHDNSLGVRPGCGHKNEEN